VLKYIKTVKTTLEVDMKKDSLLYYRTFLKRNNCFLWFVGFFVLYFRSL